MRTDEQLRTLLRGHLVIGGVARGTNELASVIGGITAHKLGQKIRDNNWVEFENKRVGKMGLNGWRRIQVRF